MMLMMMEKLLIVGPLLYGGSYVARGVAVGYMATSKLTLGLSR